MTILRFRTMQTYLTKLVRNFYETMLILAIGLLLQWNEWHLMYVLNTSRLGDKMPERQPHSWSSIFFTSGLLLTLMQYRPNCFKESKQFVRNALLLLELFTLLFLVDFMLIFMWHPFFNIFDQALHTLGHSKWQWAQFIYHYMPGLSKWLINDAFYIMRFVSSISWFLTSIEAYAASWRLTIDYLILGQLPDIKIANPYRSRRRRRCPQHRLAQVSS